MDLFANTITSTCAVPEIESSILAQKLFQRFFENREPFGTVQLLALGSGDDIPTKKHILIRSSYHQPRTSRHESFDHVLYRAKNAKERARQSAVHASLDKIALANQLLEETNEILLQSRSRVSIH